MGSEDTVRTVSSSMTKISSSRRSRHNCHNHNHYHYCTRSSTIGSNLNTHAQNNKARIKLKQQLKPSLQQQYRRTFCTRSSAAVAASDLAYLLQRIQYPNPNHNPNRTRRQLLYNDHVHDSREQLLKQVIASALPSSSLLLNDNHNHSNKIGGDDRMDTILFHSRNNEEGGGGVGDPSTTAMFHKVARTVYRSFYNDCNFREPPQAQPQPHPRSCSSEDEDDDSLKKPGNMMNDLTTTTTRCHFQTPTTPPETPPPTIIGDPASTTTKTTATTHNNMITPDHATTRMLVVVPTDNESSSDEEYLTKHSTTLCGNEELEKNQSYSYISFQDRWVRLLEALQLELIHQGDLSLLAGRTFKLHRLSGRIVPLRNHLRDLTKRIENALHKMELGRVMREFRVYATTTTTATNKNALACSSNNSNEAVWIQVCMGRSRVAKHFAAQHMKGGTVGLGARHSNHHYLHYHIHNSKKKSKNAPYGADFHAVLQPGSIHVAVASAGPAAKENLHRLFVSILDAAVTFGCGKQQEETSSSCVSSSLCKPLLSGPDPMDLLRMASSIEDQTSLGRFALYHARGNTLDPVSAFVNEAATGKMMSIDAMSHSHRATSTSASKVGGQLLLDYSATERNIRTRMHTETFGRDQDCPKQTRVRWDLKCMHSYAATTASASAAGASSSSMMIMMGQFASALKCRVVFRGADITAGMRALIEAGEYTATSSLRDDREAESEAESESESVAAAYDYGDPQANANANTPSIRRRKRF